jgi:hypothetical protein
MRALIFSLLVTSLLLFAQQLLAQKQFFIVVAAKGEVNIGKKQVPKGDSLIAGQSITLGANSSLYLANQEYKLIEISKKGNYTFEKLALQVPKKQNIEKSYLQILLNELTKADSEKVSTRGRLKHLNLDYVKHGGLLRNNIEAIRWGKYRYHYDTTPMLYGNKLFLFWWVEDIYIEKMIDSYKVEILDAHESTYYEQITKQTELMIDLGQVKNGEDKNLLIRITELDKRGKRLAKIDINSDMVSLSDENTKANLSQELTRFNNKSLIGLLEKAKYFESKGLYLDAMVAYKEAEELMK